MLSVLKGAVLSKTVYKEDSIKTLSEIASKFLF